METMGVGALEGLGRGGEEGTAPIGSHHAPFHRRGQRAGPGTTQAGGRGGRRPPLWGGEGGRGLGYFRGESDDFAGPRRAAPFTRLESSEDLGGDADPAGGGGGGERKGGGTPTRPRSSFWVLWPAPWRKARRTGHCIQHTEGAGGKSRQSTSGPGGGGGGRRGGSTRTPTLRPAPGGGRGRRRRTAGTPRSQASKSSSAADRRGGGGEGERREANGVPVSNPGSRPKGLWVLLCTRRRRGAVLTAAGGAGTGGPLRGSAEARGHRCGDRQGRHSVDNEDFRTHEGGGGVRQRARGEGGNLELGETELRGGGGKTGGEVSGKAGGKRGGSRGGGRHAGAAEERPKPPPKPPGRDQDEGASGRELPRSERAGAVPELGREKVMKARSRKGYNGSQPPDAVERTRR